MVIKDLVKSLNPTEKDDLYRELWSEYVREDIISFIDDDLMAKLEHDDINEMVRRYVYDGEYDCNLSYWDNIQNLIDDYLRRN